MNLLIRIIPVLIFAVGPLCAQSSSMGRIRYKTFQRNEIIQWEKRFINNTECLVSPVINHGRNKELNHHNVTVNYEGSGTIKLSLAHSFTSNLDHVLNQKHLVSRPAFIRNQSPRRITSNYKGEKNAWIILSKEGDVKITSIRHSCWVGEKTLYGHMPVEFKYKGKKLKFRIKFPNDYNPKKSYPLVLSIGGSGGVGDGNSRNMEMVILGKYLFTKYYASEEFNCFSLVPQIPILKDVPAPYYPKVKDGLGAPDKYHPDWPTVNENGWYTQATMELIGRLLRSPSFNVDPNRVYFAGFSYGGKACWEFLKAGRDVFAGAISVAGWPIGRCYSNPSDEMRGRLKLEVQRYKHIPVWVFAGQKDNMKYGSKAVFEEITLQGGKSSYIEFPSADHVASATSTWNNRRYLKWLFEQNKSKNPPAEADPFPGGKYPQ